MKNNLFVFVLKSISETLEQDYQNQAALDIALTLASHRGGVLKNFRLGTQVINVACHLGTQTN